jgi:hypothetical protein
MKSYRYLHGILILALLFIVIVACDDTPIFYTLEKAYKTSDDRGMDDTASVLKIVYTGAGGNYFANAQSVYQRDEGASGTWQRVTPPASGALCGGLEYFAGAAPNTIIAWFYNSEDLKPVGLFKRDPSTAPGDPWTEITDIDWPTDNDWPDLQFRIHFIKAAGTELFVSTAVYDSAAQTTTYNLYYSLNATNNSFNVCNTDYGTDLNEMIVDVEHDGTDYWFITNSGASGVAQPRYLYRNTAAGDPSDFDDVSAAGPDFSYNSNDPEGRDYTPHSLYFASASGRLYLSGLHGRIFFRPTAGTWSTWDGDPEIVTVKKRDYTVRFTGFVEYVPSGQIFVGSSEYGYYSFSDSLPGPVSAADLTRQPAQSLYEYPPIELVNGAITSFLLNTDEDPDVLFACTAGAGLWRGDWDTTKWVWVQE